MTQAMLPEGLIEAGIENMKVGDAAYVVPWAMWVDAARRCWLHPKYTLSPLPHGTAQLRVESREDGFHVVAPAGEKWRPGDDHCYVSAEPIGWIPVRGLQVAK